jgi:putative peptide modification system cyclase
MNLKVTLPPRTAAGSPVTPVLRAVLLADLADSTAFVQRFGDARAAAALQRLDLQIRDLLEFTGGRLIDKADGLLAIFERPIQAVDFALRYQQALRQFSVDEGTPLAARVGIHVGELMTWANTDADVRNGAKPLEVEGLAKPVAARLMALALPGQILVSSMAQALAQRAQAELGAERAERVRWMSHGRYRFKGVPAPVLVHEVGEVGASPLKQPPSGHKVWRELPLWRRPPVLAAELMVMLGLVGFFGWSALRSPPALAFQQRDWVVVGDLSNFTGDTRLDDSLDTALRVSLEQSRYVNVVPDLKIRSVLQRMGRQDATVDRAVGSEIAMREGARALLLPSVAEVGGKLRVSLELVDPNTGATVYADSEEGKGVDSALASLDVLDRRLRERLGESTAQIKAAGKPLAEITTPSIEALRLYTLARDDSVLRGDLADSMRLIELAIKADPEFALAYTARARLHLANGENAAAKQDFLTANRFRARLSAREALTLDSGLAEFGPVQPRVDIYKTGTRAYPDNFGGYYNLAINEAIYQHRFGQALADLQPALVTQNPNLRSAVQMSGFLLTGLGRLPEAREAFERAEGLGLREPIRYYADSYAASRQFDRARQLISTSHPTGLAGFDLEARLPEITYAVDEGQWQQAVSTAEKLSKLAPGDAPLQSRTYRATWLGLRAYAPDAKLSGELRALVADELPRATEHDGAEVVPSTFASLFGSAMLARVGDVKSARETLAKLEHSAPALGYPAIDDMMAVAQAEVELSSGNAAQAVAQLRNRVNGDELVMVHATLLRAFLRTGELADAVREAEWLRAHRGLAYVEWNSQCLAQPLNVLESDLAMLSLAEISRQNGDVALAKRQLAQFLEIWKHPPPMVEQRVSSLQDWISQRTSGTGKK